MEEKIGKHSLRNFFLRDFFRYRAIGFFVLLVALLIISLVVRIF